jgi:ABC-type Zn uptake system ZnuABC Zn-binding protein ZnuA
MDLLGGWLGALQPFRGRPIITYHNSWPYFVKRFGLVAAAQLEPKPGIPPSPAHLLDVISIAKSEEVPVILMEPWLNKKPALFVASKAGSEIIEAATSTLNNKEPYNYISALDDLIMHLASVLASK